MGAHGSTGWEHMEGGTADKDRVWICVVLIPQIYDWLMPGALTMHCQYSRCLNTGMFILPSKIRSIGIVSHRPWSCGDSAKSFGTLEFNLSSVQLFGKATLYLLQTWKASVLVIWWLTCNGIIEEQVSKLTGIAGSEREWCTGEHDWSTKLTKWHWSS